jgi:peptidylprolyl isomerase
MRKALWSTLTITLAIVGCGNDAASPSTPPAKTPPPSTATGGTPANGQTGTTPTTAAPKVAIKDIKPGKGRAAAEGDSVWVSYVGSLTNGTVFDSTERNGGKPFPVVLGAGQVIKGWDQGLVGSKVGMQRELRIPYQLAYGEAGRSPSIPPKADLVFVVDVLAVLKQGDEGVVDVTELKKGNGAVVKEGSKITVNYVGTTVNGIEFDSTKKQGKPFTFTVGKHETLPGIDAGVVGMKKGGKRRLFIPPSLGLRYGNESVPPNSPIFVEIEVLDVK